MPNDGTEQRKLAAIMFTDMVGYSALSQRNEKLAQELLEEHRALLRPLFPKFNGTEIKTIGDAFLVEFHSALEAAQCGIEIQRALAKRNADAPTDHRIELKIGIHIGDVVHRGGDVYGDGVNIASRIEPLAGAGGICVSMDVERQIRNALEARFEKLAPTELKNISVPMDLFRIVLPWETQSSSRREEAQTFKSEIRNPKSEIEKSLVTSVAAKFGWIAAMVLVAVGIGWWLVHQSGKATKQIASSPRASTLPAAPSQSPVTDQKSIAVLPFVNMSADKDNEYLSDGITEEILNALAKVPGLRVPARTSSFVFKDKKEDVRKIGELLNVGTVLEGSVRKAGNQLRITAQLINVADGFHLWSETYDRDMTNIFAIQDDIARTIVAKLQVKLTGPAARSSAKPRTEKVEAYESYLKGMFHMEKYAEPDVRQAITHFQQALEQQPDYALAYAGLALAYANLRYYAYVSPGSVTPQIRAAIAKALELDDELAEAHRAQAHVNVWVDWDWAAAESAYKRALELDPSSVAAHSFYAFLLALTGRHQEAIAEATKAQQLDPLAATIQVNAGWMYHYARNYDRALEAGRKAIAMAPDFFFAYQMMGASLFRKGLREEGIAQMETAARLSPVPQVLATLGWMYGRVGRKADAQKVLDQFLAQAKEKYVPALAIAIVYDGLGDIEQANVWMNKAIEDREGRVVFLNAALADDITRANPYYAEWLKKIGLDK